MSKENIISLKLKNGDKLNLKIDNLGEQNSKVVTI